MLAMGFCCRKKMEWKNPMVATGMVWGSIRHSSSPLKFYETAETFQPFLFCSTGGSDSKTGTRPIRGDAERDQYEFMPVFLERCSNTLPAEKLAQRPNTGRDYPYCTV